MDVRYYLSPFLSSHSLHLIVGPKGAGKTTYALQMLGQRISDEPESSPWSQFSRGELPEVIWYVDLIKPRKNVLEHVAKLGLSQPDVSARSLRILTYEQILEARPEQNRKDPITFSDVLMRIGIETAGELPAILIIDGFSALLTSTSKEVSQASFESERLREIDRIYLSMGGCLIGIQTFAKSGRIPGIETPGTHILSAFVASVTELSFLKGTKRKVTIEGRFSSRSMVLEFSALGQLRIPSTEVKEAPPKKRESTDSQILNIVIELSLMNPPNMDFQRKELLEAARETLGIESSTVDRWLKRNRLAGSIRSTDVRGVFCLHPKPEPPLIQ